MIAKRKSKKQIDDKSHPEPRTFQASVVSAPEADWFFAWLKSAALYLSAVSVYLGLVIAFAKRLNKIYGTSAHPDAGTYVLAVVCGLPLILGFFFNLLPALRRRQERSMRPATIQTENVDTTYFQTSPRQDDAHRLFDKGYEAYLEWARVPKEPLLFLTGPSGTGKSSLLAAYLKPHLAEPVAGSKTTLLLIRSYENPLIALKEALVKAESGLWKSRPADYDNLSPLVALHRAARQLGSKERLLIAFDQFEEFFLLRGQLISDEEQVDTTKSISVPKEEIDELQIFFRAFLDDPPERIAILLSYRDDHHRLLEPLGLPARVEGVNALRVEPLDFSAAARFLRSCPGMIIPEKRMDRVLREAARQEGSRAVMRPIVANLLGIVLRQMAGHPTLWQRNGDLLRGYVRDCLGKELVKENTAILRAMLTDFQTARARSAGEIADETGIETASVNARLERFRSDGLVRSLNAVGENRDRKWQIGHDFIATLIERVLDGANRGVWLQFRPWIAPFVLMIAGAVVIWFVSARERVIANADLLVLSQAGFYWDGPKRTIGHAASATGELRNLDAFRLLRRLSPLVINLSHTSLENVDGIAGLTTVTNVNLRFCLQLESLDGLTNLSHLNNLDLLGCERLTNVHHLAGLTELKDLNLTGSKLTNAEWIGNFKSLRVLSLAFNQSLTNIDWVKGLTNLESLSLSSCRHLSDVHALTNLHKIRNLNLNGATNLLDADCIELYLTWTNANITLPNGMRTL